MAENTPTETDSIINKPPIEHQKKAYKNHHATLLDSFTPHHQLLLQAIGELEQERNTINAGAVYQRYQKLVENTSKEKVTNRRLSTYLTQLELRNVIKAEAHYG